ncbi:MAG TPA: hypothetical protein VG148_06545 [Pyrinomonadaceae bacterium]|nr:hypothetical protein [Pyrinomonadaceae bacterium]
MNCQNFETVVGDLARGVPLDARARREAREHKESCANCAARLADERALSAGLRRLAASTEAAAAPPRVEANLLAAFRAAAHVEPARERTLPAAGKVVPLARPQAARRWSWVKTAAASATAAAAAVTLFALIPPESGPTRRAVAPNAPRPDASVASQATPSSPLAVAPMVADGGPRDAQGDVALIVTPRGNTSPRVAPARPESRPASYRNGAGRAARGARGFEPGGAEIATDFIPLTQDARFAVSEGGQMVRVELPRTALQRFGLPMNVELAGGRVKADVLLGHDGVARAIRFVR